MSALLACLTTEIKEHLHVHAIHDIANLERNRRFPTLWYKLRTHISNTASQAFSSTLQQH